ASARREAPPGFEGEWLLGQIFGRIDPVLSIPRTLASRCGRDLPCQRACVTLTDRNCRRARMMRITWSPPRCLALLLVMASIPFVEGHARADEAAVVREEVGTRISENIPPIPAALMEQLNRYQNTRGASVAGWTDAGCLLIGTRFAETTQVQRAPLPVAARAQMTFYDERLASLAPAPAVSARNGFVFSRDVGGNEFSQLYWFDLDSRETRLLTDGKRSQNHGPLFSDDGRWLA